jgi:geranylgeranyl pyrophosphate synthase
MAFEEIKAGLRAMAEVKRWPELAAMIERPVHRESASAWDYPILACQAVGSRPEAALPGATAVFCAMISIHLVDDMLDDDPAGDFHRLGAGVVANVSLAFQALGHRALAAPAVPAEVRLLTQQLFSEMMLATSLGQHLDSQGAQSEADYWRIVEAKTPPLFAAALEMGALLGGGAREVAAELGQLGRCLGRLVQVSDDLSDALATPARPDWSRPKSCLPILYGLTADHADREELEGLCLRVREPGALAAAQKILLQSGAVSYCVFNLVATAEEIRRRLAEISLADPRSIERLVAVNTGPLRRMLATVGLDEVPELSLGS